MAMRYRDYDRVGTIEDSRLKRSVVAEVTRPVTSEPRGAMAGERGGEVHTLS